MSLMSTKEMAERLGLRRHQLIYLIDSGTVGDASVRVSSRRAFTEEDYIAAQAKVGNKTVTQSSKTVTVA